MAKNYLFKNATVFKDTNSRGEYMWAIAELFYEEDEYENPNVLPTYPLLLEDTVKKFGKCSVLDEDRTKRAGGTRKVYRFDLDKAYEAISNKKFADGSACSKKRMVDGKLEEFPDDFVHITNVEAFDQKLTGGPWARIALYDTDVKLANGTTKHVNRGDFLVGKNGNIMPVTELRVYVKVGTDGKPIESITDRVNAILERAYKPLPTGNVVPINKPEGAPNEPTKSAEDIAKEEAQKKAEDEALGSAF